MSTTNSKSTCEWPGCEELSSVRVHGRIVCERHQKDALAEIVLEGPRGLLDEKGRPTDSRWLNSFARLVVLTVPESALGGLTKAKIQERAARFEVAGPVVTFAIERHPARGSTEQTWRYDVGKAELTLIKERVVSSELAVGPDGSDVCPKCGSRDIEITPGRVICRQCGFLILHEHTARAAVAEAMIASELALPEEEEGTTAHLPPWRSSRLRETGVTRREGAHMTRNPERTAEELRATAYHEAGHAVASLVFKERFKCVTILPSDECAGSVDRESSPEDDLRATALAKGGYVNLREMVVLAAGGYSEMEARGIDLHREDFTKGVEEMSDAWMGVVDCMSSDTHRILVEACEPSGANEKWVPEEVSEAAIMLLEGAAGTLAMSLVKIFSPVIADVAAVLLERKTLTYDEVKEICLRGEAGFFFAELEGKVRP